MNRLTAFLIVLAIWAAIYLPGLGAPEMKGEEGRRVMPAVTMLDGGSLIVPYVGGKPFLRKPPLVQWCMAASMKVFGRNVWAVRLPSVLSVLALAAVIIFCTRGWLIVEHSLLAAIIMMVQVAMIEKCRLAELEAVYVGLSGIALVLWMSWWTQGKSDWLVWTVPFVFNGLALLAKAPLHLLFFYAVVVAALAAAGELRRLFSLPHFAGLLVMLGIGLAWYLPYKYSGVIDAAELSNTLQRQAIERFTGAEFHLSKWLLSIPNGIANHLPWVLFAPLMWRRDALDGMHPRTAALVRGGRWAVAGCFVGLLLIPGVLPRYVQPLVAPFSVLLAPVLWNCPARVLEWWRKGLVGLTVVIFLAAIASPFVVAAAVNRGAPAMNPISACLLVLIVFSGALFLMSLRKSWRESVQLTVWTGLVAGMVMVIFAVSAVPWMLLKDDLRPFAARIDAAMPADSVLIAYGLNDFAPLLATLFYLDRTSFSYASDADAAPEGRHHYLVRGKDLKKFRNRFTIEGDPLAEWKAGEEKEASVVVVATKRAK